MMCDTSVCKKMEIDDARLRKHIAKCEKRILLLEDALQQYLNIVHVDASVSILIIQTADDWVRLTALKEAYARELQEM